MSRVKAHRRKVGGKTVKVRQHSRRLDTHRAGRNYLRAYRNSKRKRHGKAAMWAGIATAELGGFVLMRGAGVALVTVGLGLFALGRAARKATADGSPKPAQRAAARPEQRRAPKRPETAAERGRRHAQEDVTAGGFGKGWSGDRTGEMSEQDSADYEREYMRNTPRSWRS